MSHNRFISSGRSGFCFAVAQEGELAAGDRLEIVSRGPHGVSVAEVALTRLAYRRVPQHARRAAAGAMTAPFPAG